jgi:hypothetical protein
MTDVHDPGCRATSPRNPHTSSRPSVWTTNCRVDLSGCADGLSDRTIAPNSSSYHNFPNLFSKPPAPSSRLNGFPEHFKVNKEDAERGLPKDFSIMPRIFKTHKPHENLHLLYNNLPEFPAGSTQTSHSQLHERGAAELHICLCSPPIRNISPCRSLLATIHRRGSHCMRPLYKHLIYYAFLGFHPIYTHIERLHIISTSLVFFFDWSQDPNGIGRYTAPHGGLGPKRGSYLPMYHRFIRSLKR